MCWTSVVTLGVGDIRRSKETYEAHGYEVDKEVPGRMSFKPGERAAVLEQYPREGTLALIGISGEGN